MTKDLIIFVFIGNKYENKGQFVDKKVCITLYVNIDKNGLKNKSFTERYSDFPIIGNGLNY